MVEKNMSKNDLLILFCSISVKSRSHLDRNEIVLLFFQYHEKIADFRSLPQLPKAAVAKIIAVTSPLTPRFKGITSIREIHFGL